MLIHTQTHTVNNDTVAYTYTFMSFIFDAFYAWPNLERDRERRFFFFTFIFIFSFLVKTDNLINNLSIYFIFTKKKIPNL